MADEMVTSDVTILDALRKRRCYATNGPRIWLRFALDGRPMGSTLPVSDEETQQLDVAVVSPGPLERIDVIRSGIVLEPQTLDGERSFSGLLDLPRLESGEYGGDGRETADDPHRVLDFHWRATGPW